ncbi:zinc finger BED domain-containing 1-like protein [Labeo rohita]|uniref:Zinc finger BED domain-containing 1-like protein n=1 Tax=Labeo rohita TaxID=84645 RepID=A0A498M0W0_LABRO|nr:zinc finger BED domain-containing 1-like protein [Labeo rohita]
MRASTLCLLFGLVLLMVWTSEGARLETCDKDASLVKYLTNTRTARVCSVPAFLKKCRRYNDFLGKCLPSRRGRECFAREVREECRRYDDIMGGCLSSRSCRECFARKVLERYRGYDDFLDEYQPSRYGREVLENDLAMYPALFIQVVMMSLQKRKHPLKLKAFTDFVAGRKRALEPPVRLSPAEIVFLTEYCTVMKPLVTALNILQSETNTHLGVAPAGGLSVRSQIKQTGDNFQDVSAPHQSSSGWYRKVLWWDDKRS